MEDLPDDDSVLVLNMKEGEIRKEGEINSNIGQAGRARFRVIGRIKIRVMSVPTFVVVLGEEIENEIVFLNPKNDTLGRRV